MTGFRQHFRGWGGGG